MTPEDHTKEIIATADNLMISDIEMIVLLAVTKGYEAGIKQITTS
jgi:hypothetical protein